MRLIRGWLIVALALSGMACGDDDGGVDGDAGFTADAGPPPDAGPADGGTDAGPPPPSRPATAPYTAYVDPLIGTGGLGFGVGSVSPAPQRPFGLARPAPDTSEPDGAPGFNHCAGYYWEDSLIQGFSQVRPHGMGIPEYGVIALMPSDGVDASKTTQTGYRQAFSHDDETVEVGYYDVTLESGTRVELTAGERVARHRVTFPESVEEPTLLVDVGHFIGEIDITGGAVSVDAEAGEIAGHSTFDGGYSGRSGGVTVYFVARFDTPFARHGVWSDGALAEGDEASGTAAGAWVGFDGREVEVAVGLSFTDVAHARMNLEAEPEGFDAMRAATVEAWEALLSRVRIEARSDEELTLFYSALYRSLLMPTLAMDVDGTYRGLDGEVHAVPEDDPFRYYTDHSLWDTFRTQGPLLSLLYPALQRDMVRSLMAMAEDGGWMPRWPLGTGYTGGMVGDSAGPWIVDAWVKGVGGFDAARAYALLRRTAFEATPPGAPYGGRSGIEPYMELGWVPMDRGASASLTLEFAYDDWALAKLAEGVGEDEDAAALRERAGNWRNLWDPASEFLVGRAADGSFPEGELDLLRWQDYYAEGNAWQYLWYVPHDLAGLTEQMGGEARFFERLDFFFESSTRRPQTLLPENYYWHGNEPDIHAPWIYSALGRPDESARWVRWVMRTYYDATPAGIPGNDDAGTLSAWYVFAALGFYPITAADDYLLAAPTLTRAELDLPGGTMVVEAPEASAHTWRLGSVRFEGEPIEDARLPHASLADGGTLRWELVP